MLASDRGVTALRSRCAAADGVLQRVSLGRSRQLGIRPVCRYDTRKSANNVAERRKHAKKVPAVLEADAEASSTAVAQRARALVGFTHGQLSLQLCLALFLQQQQLLSLNTKHIGARVLSLADALAMRPADVGQLLLRCGALVDVLPLRLRSAADALAAALCLSRPQALAMLSRDLNLLDTPPLRVKQFLDSLVLLLLQQEQPQAQQQDQAQQQEPEQAQQQAQQQARQLQRLLYGMASRCPHLLRVDAGVLQVRYARLHSVLGLGPGAVQQLLAREPRLLMPSSQVLAQNHAALLKALSLASEDLARWAAAAPMLLLVPAGEVRDRMTALRACLDLQGRQLLQQQRRRPLVGPQQHQQQQQQGPAGGVEESGSDEDEEEEEEGEEGEEEGCGGLSDWGGRQGVGPTGQQQQQGFHGVAQPPSRLGSGGGGSSSSSWDGAAEEDLGEADAGGPGQRGGLRWRCVARDPSQLLAYVARDPRVLLLTPGELRARVGALARELSWDGGPLAAWLALTHPSYLAAEPGLINSWADDVRHLCGGGLSARQARRLAACPQVFLTMSPEDVMASLHGLAEALNRPINGQTLDLAFEAAAQVAGEEPLLLQQHPAATAAALQQLQAQVQDARLRAQLVLAAPQLLLQGPQLARVLACAAGLLTLSCSQLAVALVRDTRLWTAMVPRHTWPCCPQWQQQQQQQQQKGTEAAAAAPVPPAVAAVSTSPSPAAAVAAASMEALLRCGLRPPEVMQAAAVLHPALLRLGPDGALRHVRLLAERCSHSGRWQEQLRRGLTPEQLGRALLRAESWDDRLAFLIDLGWSHAIDLAELTQLNRAEFAANFGPEHSAWKQQQQQQQRQWQGHQGAAAAGAAQQQQRQRQGQVEEQQVDDLVAELQARLGGGWAAGAAAAASCAGAGSPGGSSPAPGCRGEPPALQQEEDEEEEEEEQQQQQQDELWEVQQAWQDDADSALLHLAGDAGDALVNGSQRVADATGGSDDAAGLFAAASSSRQTLGGAAVAAAAATFGHGGAGQANSSQGQGSRGADDAAGKQAMQGGSGALRGKLAPMRDGQLQLQARPQGLLPQPQLPQPHQPPPHQQQQEQQEQQQQEEGPQHMPQVFAAKANEPAISRWEQALEAAALSGLELYGTWHGCLMQPAEYVAAQAVQHGAGSPVE